LAASCSGSRTLSAAPAPLDPDADSTLIGTLERIARDLERVLYGLAVIAGLLVLEIFD
jgi:hypothetical protein